MAQIMYLWSCRQGMWLNASAVLYTDGPWADESSLEEGGKAGQVH